MTHMNWQAWNPGLDNDKLTLQEAYEAMPELPLQMSRLVERLGDKPTTLTNNFNTFDQDCLHILLGRGLLPQDEAFVLGYTMGAAGSLKDWEPGILRLVTKLCQPGEHQFTETDIQAFKLGVELGTESCLEDIHQIEFRAFLDKPLGEIREELGIDSQALRDFYKAEQKVIPGTEASQRLG